MRQFDKIAEAFGQGVQSHFLPAAQEHRNAVINIGGASSALHDAGKDLNNMLTLVAKTVEAHRDIGEHLVELVEEKAMPANELLRACVKHLEGSTADLALCTEGYMRSAHQNSTQVAQLTESVTAVAEVFEKLGERLEGSLQVAVVPEGVKHRVDDEAIAEPLKRLTQQFQQCVDGLDRLLKEQQLQNAQTAQLLRTAFVGGQATGVSVAVHATAGDRSRGDRDRHDASQADSPGQPHSEHKLPPAPESAPTQSSFTSLWQRRR
jgi:phage terminase small subunit